MPQQVKKIKPDFPQSATEETEQGAQAFIEYYYKLVEYGHYSGNWNPLRESSLPSCYWCEAFSDKNLFAPENDVWTEVNELNDIGIVKHQASAVVQLESSKGLDSIAKHPPEYEKVDHTWMDHIRIKYDDDQWKALKIKPSQTTPSLGCHKGRCMKNGGLEIEIDEQ